MQLTGFEGRVALVTGAGGGIGAALVELLASAGCTVVATDLAAPVAQARGVRAFALDVTDSGAVDALVDQVEARIGPIALVANVAGVLHVGEVVQTTDAYWRRVFAVNAEGVFHVSRAVARVMSPRRQGALVTVSSNAAGVPRHGMAAYAASKAAATMFTRCLGLELAPLGIRCNIVAPGSTLTPMQTGMWEDGQGAERVIAGNLETYKAGIPLRKLATPDDIAQSVMFLLSEQAGHVAMSDLYVDGGATLRG
ncbi:2,3-dihydro-2,3-dihydroxybenzoate dehydrogenase [Stenotrophomonas sp. S48]|uniref:2,3-dihydro-2,3-dihydroxybenzoate dehydrogenase n=1 Tax=unclassified Stenotrophomonas TaxID=196198 RepID=UPI0019013010|nr:MULTISPECIES: 2,3-dihydro-2,3-dihydroxybenzoate dehydrogenase [unclassified Stenotrophomonas]MBK0024954.1 2,3-dihydro-2,3-dihydroxybenzoate dehydrogenase [Stenotrophomonas sp. S48]MBK0047194.1 2,3-dihydro-2,3-dihydroxybenzoate dehydrogenase [Stenotrophomonas sp. S49]